MSFPMYQHLELELSFPSLAHRELLVIPAPVHSAVPAHRESLVQKH